MPRPYDVISKHLIDLHPADWLALLGLPAADAEPVDIVMLDTDLSTVTSQADRVLKVNGPSPALYHFELETGHGGSESPGRLLRYSVLASGKYSLAVVTTIVLLRREADSPALTGRFQYHRPDGFAYLTFEYNVIRIWETSVESLLGGGLGTLPLAPLGNVPTQGIPEVLRRMRERLDSEQTTDAEEAEFWTTTNILMGLRLPETQISELLKGVRRMKESTTYQAILQEGEAIGEARGEAIGEARGEAIGKARGRVEGSAQGVRSVILRQGRKRFGDPSAATMSTVEAISSIDQLEQLAERLLEVESWGELLADS